MSLLSKTDARKLIITRFIHLSCLVLIVLTACSTNLATTSVIPSRSVSIPIEAIKMTPESDAWPPEATADWSQPLPMEGPVNTAGGEDSPFITLDGQSFYFFFTPDINIPAERSILDGITGIWMTTWSETGWGEPRRVVLSKANHLAMDGCPFVLDDLMVFCTVRAGNLREVDLFTAQLRDGIWTNWRNWGKKMNLEYLVGEMHISADGRELYFGSDRPGGYGGVDLWISTWSGSEWDEPVNLGVGINTPSSENRPYVTADGRELWFDSTSKMGYPGPAIFRSLRQPDGSWGEAEEVFSSFAGEPTLSADASTIYFVHHFFSDDLSQMIEVDIYTSTRIP